MFTVNDMREQIIRALDGREIEFDVDGIVDEIQAAFGTVDIDTIPDTDFWTIVKEHAR